MKILLSKYLLKQFFTSTDSDLMRYFREQKNMVKKRCRANV